MFYFSDLIFSASMTKNEFWKIQRNVVVNIATMLSIRAILAEMSKKNDLFRKNNNFFKIEEPNQKFASDGLK